jgi:PAS domain S-box-containing protein
MEAAHLAEPTVIRSVRKGRVLAIIAGTIGVVTLAGWWLGVARLRAPVPGTAEMAPNSALMLIACGAALALLATPASPVRRRLARGLAALVVATAAITVIEWIGHVDLGIDALVTGEAVRPAPNTSVTFALLGGALLALDWRPWRGLAVAEVLGLAALSQAVLVGVGYAFGYVYFASPFDLPAAVDMAVHTAVGVGLLAVAVLAVRPRRGLMAILTSPYVGGVMARRLLLVAILLIPFSDVVSVSLQHAGLFPAPGAAVLDAVVSLAVIFGALLAVGHALNRADEQRGRMEEDLRRWERFFERAAFGAVFGGTDGRILQVNAAYARMHGYAPDELVGQPVIDVFSPAVRAHVARDLALVAELGSHRFESEHLRKDGGVFPVVIDATAVTDDRGRLLYRVAYVQDITAEKDAARERLAAEAALERAHVELQRVVSANQAVSEAMATMADTGLRHVLEVIADQARILTGAARAKIEVLAGPALDRPRAASTSPLTPGPDSPGPIDIPVEYGGERKGDIVLTPRPDAGAFTESDRRAAAMLASHLGSAIEVALLYERETLQRAWLASILAQLPDGVIVVDADNQVVLKNQAAHRLGVGPDRPLRDDAGQLIPDTERPCSRALAGERVTAVELIARTADGELLPVAVSAAPVRGRDGIAGAVAVYRDVRTHKELERLREEWASLIAHDLRQPVNGIRLAAELLLRAPLEERHRAWAQRIQADILRLNDMIQDLLDTSRLEAHRLALHREPTPVAVAVDAALTRLPDLAARCTVTIAPAAAHVLADPGRLVQVLGNLLSNAAKYGDPDRPVAVTVARDGGHARITVANHGEGIPEAEIPALFNRFVRTREARRGRIEGSGLGLYLCRGLVEGHGGRIWVESVPGDTTSFHFTMPLAAAAPTAAGRTKAEGHAEL